MRVPTRPSQNDPKRVKVWERRRRAVGERIWQFRKDIAMSLSELAVRSGVSRNVLADVEEGRRGLLYERLGDIAKALDVPMSELLVDIE